MMTEPTQTADQNPDNYSSNHDLSQLAYEYWLLDGLDADEAMVAAWVLGARQPGRK